MKPQREVRERASGLIQLKEPQPAQDQNQELSHNIELKQVRVISCPAWIDFTLGNDLMNIPWALQHEDP